MKKISVLKYLLTFFLIAGTAFFVSGTAWADKDLDIDNGIPVVYLNIDETQGTIEEMSRSFDHSAYCYGTVTIEVPEGFHYTDFPDLPCESLKDLAMSIRGRGKPPLKEPEKYCRAAGRLILFFGLASLLMSVLLLFSAPIALAEIIAATAILGAGWAKMNREFGA